ncbi:MAG: hypothetical protein DRI34_01645 [Deltaproteobacteria bacterium]|nr:MAG: hypothetical protein DRI34_01645 [Deltaproteobacteria bacterium]
MNRSGERQAEETWELLTRVEKLSLRILEVLEGPELDGLDRLLGERQACIDRLSGLDTTWMARLEEHRRRDIISYFKKINDMGGRLLERARHRAEQLAASRRQNAVARRAATGYRPPRLRLVIDRRLEA